MEKITLVGKEKLEKELKALEKDERPALAKRLKTAISFGDLSENAAYSEAKDDQITLEQRIAEIKEKLRTSEIIKYTEGGNAIRVGSTFEVSSDNGPQTFSLVGKEESNPLEGKISFDSPLGSAFINKKEGEVVEVITPSGKKTYTVERIK